VEPFDLIFVDGRRRVECMVAALQRLTTGGVILLHDASRKLCRASLSELGTSDWFP